MTLRIRHLKRLSTLIGASRDDSLGHVTPFMRSSMPAGLGESDSPIPETIDLDNQCKDEWTRIRAVVYALFQTKFDSRSGHQATFERGQLSSLHDDIHALLLSKAGAFIFEFYQTTLLIPATELMLHNITQGMSDLVTNLTATWQHFYTHIVPALEAIFLNIKGSRLSIRQATLLAFRDVIVLPLEPDIAPIVSEIYQEGSVSPALRQMFLVLQGISECYPPSKQRLDLEILTARVVSPYLGFYGLYQAGEVQPVISSRELDVAHLRRTSVTDPRGLSRPLSVSSSLHMETLNDLFTLSADRFAKRSASRDNF